MNIEIKEVSEFHITEQRYRWLKDEEVDRYIGFAEELEPNVTYQLKPDNERHFEIYFENSLAGDIRFLYNSEDDKIAKRAEFIIIIGKRNRGLGSLALPLVIEKVKTYYTSIYCYIHKSNFRSLKLMKKNGFYVSDIEGAELLLELDLN
ncbi:MAG: GNAT family N-acetyltransferase [Calditrichaeota bacterium]|nr:GNAT family N-acetyltransferase [Calditrichota bacterium]